MKYGFLRFLSALGLTFLVTTNVYAGHLFTQNTLNTPVTISSGTGVSVRQLRYETGSTGTNGLVTLAFNQGNSVDPNLAWNAGDSLRLTIGNYQVSISYDTIANGTSGFGSASQGATSLYLSDPNLVNLVLNPAVTVTGTQLGHTTINPYTWTIESLSGSFSFEGYRIYFGGIIFDGNSADQITQNSVVSSTQLSSGNTGPDVINTLIGLVATASDLRSTFANQGAAQTAGLDYDCNLFGENHVCVSAGGRLTNTLNDTVGTVNSTAAILVGSYRYDSELRLGGWLDQNLNRQDRSVRLENSSPMIGIFGVYAPSGNDLGPQIKLAASYVTKNMEITRPMLTGTEPGKGSTRYSSTAALIEAGYGMSDVIDGAIVTPFAGLRVYRGKNNSYTEATTADVQNPLSFDGYKQVVHTAVLGAKLNARVDEFLLNANFGIESDLKHNTPTLSGASSINGMSYFSVEADSKPRYKRGFASAGVGYLIDKDQRVDLKVHYRQDMFYRVDSITTLLTYTAGF